MNSQRLNELAVSITERLFDTGAADQEATQNALAFVVANLKPVFECLESADKDGREYAILAGTNAARAEKAERERDELRKTLQATQGGATEAIKNVMRLQEEISRLDKESQRLSDQLGACDRQRLDWLKRALTAEAEIARRDAAAGEPVAVISEDSLAELKQSYRPVLVFRPDHKRNSPGISLYTAAQPAVLPGEVEELSMLIRRLVRSLKNSNPHSGLLKSVPDYMRRKGFWKSTDCMRGDDVKQG